MNPLNEELSSLRDLPELEPPPELDRLVIERAVDVLADLERPDAVPARLPRVEVLAYTAGLAMYFAQALNVAARFLARVLSG